MKRALAVLLLLAGLAAAPAQANDTPSALGAQDRAAIADVIEQQLRAFRADDGPAAFALASPGIQMQFGDALTFIDMVRRGYRPVYRPRSYSFGALVDSNGRTVQRLELVGPDGQRALALYYMEQQPDGSWRVSGCMLTESADVGA
jgi:hypothetical protein